eukprot:2700562-Rhodomonas_salina.1
MSMPILLLLPFLLPPFLTLRHLLPSSSLEHLSSCAPSLSPRAPVVLAHVALALLTARAAGAWRDQGGCRGRAGGPQDGC